MYEVLFLINTNHCFSLIVLSNLKGTHAEVVAMVKEGDGTKIGAERLRGLYKILPEKEEMAMINAYDGEVAKLGNAEKFYLTLGGLKGYTIRVEGMLLKVDFRVAMDALRPNVDVIIEACTKLRDNESLKAFLRYVLHAGNFINAGGYAGNALGFKIASLNKLMDTRANKPRVTLLHYLVGRAVKEEDSVLDFADELSGVLCNASRFTLDNLSSEARQLEANVKRLEGQVGKAEGDIRVMFAGFIKVGGCV